MHGHWKRYICVKELFQNNLSSLTVQEKTMVEDAQQKFTV